MVEHSNEGFTEVSGKETGAMHNTLLLFSSRERFYFEDKRKSILVHTVLIKVSCKLRSRSLEMYGFA